MTTNTNYFVQLTESGQTVNLAQISSISWHEVPEGCGWEESGCVATISFVSSYICITPGDAQELWDALNRYNTRLGQALTALPQLVNALTALVEVELSRTGFEEYSSPTSPQSPPPQSVQSQNYQQQQKQPVPPTPRSAGDGSSGSVPTGSDYSEPQAGRVGSASAAGKVRVNPTGAVGSTQPVVQRQRHSITH